MHAHAHSIIFMKSRMQTKQRGRMDGRFRPCPSLDEGALLQPGSGQGELGARLGGAARGGLDTCEESLPGRLPNCCTAVCCVVPARTAFCVCHTNRTHLRLLDVRRLLSHQLVVLPQPSHTLLLLSLGPELHPHTPRTGVDEWVVRGKESTRASGDLDSLNKLKLEQKNKLPDPVETSGLRNPNNTVVVRRVGYTRVSWSG